MTEFPAAISDATPEEQPPQGDAGQFHRAIQNAGASVAPITDQRANMRSLPDRASPAAGADQVVGGTLGRRVRATSSRRKTGARGQEKIAPLPGGAASDTMDQAMPSVTPDPMSPDPDGGGQHCVDPRLAAASAVLSLRELQSRRVACVKAQLRLTNAAGAFVRRALGWRMDMDEKERNAINKRAAKLIDEIETGGHQISDIQGRCAAASDGGQGATDSRLTSASVAPFVLAVAEGRKPFDAMRKETEKEMRRIAETLPVYPWVASVKGFGSLGLAIIVGECGDLGEYRKGVAGIWKRLGLAVMDGKRQGNPGEGAKAEDWIAHGYNARRRSAMWTLGDSLLKCGGDGPWRTLYLERKAYELARAPDMRPMQAHRRAQRYVEKRLLRTLWQEWRRAIGRSETTLVSPAAGDEAAIPVVQTANPAPPVTSLPMAAD